MNVPIIHSRPMIPIGAIAGTGTGGVGGASATTTKPGDPLSGPSGVKRLPKYPVPFAPVMRC